MPKRAGSKGRPYITLGWRLKIAREEAGFEQAEMAALLVQRGFRASRATISLWESDHGMRDPFGVINAWSEITGYELDFFLEAIRERAQRGKTVSHQRKRPSVWSNVQPRQLTPTG